MSMTMEQVEVFTGGSRRRLAHPPTLVDQAGGLGRRTTLDVPSWAPLVVTSLAVFGTFVLVSWAFKGVRAVGVGTRAGVAAAGRSIKA